MRQPKKKRILPKAKLGRRRSSRRISRRRVRLERCLPLSRDQQLRRKNSLHSPLPLFHRSHLNRLARVLLQDLLVQTQTTILPMYVNAALKPNSFNCRVGSMFVRSAYWMRFMRKNRTKMSIWRCSTKCRTLWGSGWSSCRATRLTFRTNSNNNSSSLTTPGNPMLSNPPPKNFQSGRAPVLSQLSQIHNKYKSKKSQRNMLQTNNRRNLQQLWLSILLHSNHPKPHQTKSFGISNSPAATLHLPSNRLRIERGQQSRLLQICSGRS